MNEPLVPDRIKLAAHARIAETLSAQRPQRAAEAIDSHVPLVAEPDVHRAVRRAVRKVKVDAPTALRIVGGASPASLGLSGDRLHAAESIQGTSADFVPVSFFDGGEAAASAVGRVVHADGSPWGSGFLVSNGLFLTNNHVIPTAADADGLRVQFNYQCDALGKEQPVTSFAFAPERFFVTDPEDDLDFTLIALAETGAGPASLESLGFCPLSDGDAKHMLGEFVNIIQHPEGDYKQVVLRENQLANRFPRVLHYSADTQPGSSGSPVFNDDWEAVALHHWGEPYLVTTRPDGTPVRRDVNEGVRISAIVEALRAARSSLGPRQQALLDAALNVPFRWPSLLQPADGRANGHPISPPSRQPQESKKGQGIVMQLDTRVNPGGSMTFTIPLLVTVSIPGVDGAPAPAAPKTNGHAPKASTRRAGESAHLDFEGATGYDPGFLDGFEVPLPRITPRALGKPAALLDPGDADPYELHYVHFTIVMNEDRRMAFFTGVNIDGANSRIVDRKTGKVKDGGERGGPRGDDGGDSSEAVETWYVDDRIAASAQCDQSIYANQQPKRVFDRGHQVRREDPVWGDDDTAEQANAQTFGFCNCCPQQFQFNESKSLWGAIEDYVLENARAEKQRLSVFTGPVFTAADPEYRSIRVPLMFYKVVVRVEGGQLKATALVASQERLLSWLPESIRAGGGAESFDDLGKVKHFQTTVKKVEEMTGLDFGDLRDHDTFGASESLAGPMIPLRRAEDVRLR